MSLPKIVKGQYFDISVENDPVGTPGVFAIICGLTTRNLTHQFNTSDEFIRDCTDPSMVPVRVVNVTGEQFDISGTGLFNRSQGAMIRAISGKSLNYRFVMSEPEGDPVDGGFYQGPFVLSNIQFGSQDDTNASAQFTWVSDGQITWTDAAPEIVLDPLTMTPKTATHAVAYTGTIAGKTTGSTITATSSDSTALTVTGTSVAGTFTAAGSPTITLTETLASGVNSPRISTVKLTVA